MSACLFCRIASGEIPSDKIFENNELIAFRDINPQAPTHVLIVPKKHIEQVADLEESDAPLVGRLIVAAKKLANELGLEHFRLVVNNGEGAGQSVWHLHVHLLGGRSFKWPPG